MNFLHCVFFAPIKDEKEAKLLINPTLLTWYNIKFFWKMVFLMRRVEYLPEFRFARNMFSNAPRLLPDDERRAFVYFANLEPAYQFVHDWKRAVSNSIFILKICFQSPLVP